MKSEEQQQLMNRILDRRIEHPKKLFGEALIRFSRHELYVEFAAVRSI